MSSLVVARRTGAPFKNGGVRAPSMAVSSKLARNTNSSRNISTSSASASPAASAAASTFDLSPVPPARLPGTRNEFPLSPSRLVALAQELFATDTGVAEGSDALLAEDFRFEFPVISLPKQQYLNAVRSFKLRKAFPNLEAHAYDWRVDRYEPNRVWFTTRVSATHAEDFSFGAVRVKASGKEIQGAPEVNSYVFNEEGKCVTFTGGYVVDRRVGNTKGLGAVFGLLAALGAPVPGTFGFRVASFVGRVAGFFKAVVGGVFGFGRK